MDRMNQAERNLLKYLQECNDTPPTDSEIVAAFVARELAEEVRQRAISSLRWAVEPDDYDQLMAMGDLGGAELW